MEGDSDTGFERCRFNDEAERGLPLPPPPPPEAEEGWNDDIAEDDPATRWE